MLLIKDLRLRNLIVRPMIPRGWDKVAVSRLIARGLGATPAAISLGLTLSSMVGGKRIAFDISDRVTLGKPMASSATARAKRGSG